LSRLREPFDHADWLFEVKHDGFRALAYIHDGSARLVSRNGNTFKSFPGLCAWLGEQVSVRDAILDGEIVCLGPDGRTLFDPLLYRRADPHLFAFDCLWLNGSDLRALPLIERKRILRGIVPPQPARLLHVEHVAERGCDLYRAACELDLEGIVAKLAGAPYAQEPPSWFKIKNPNYTQAIGRRERFDRMRVKSASATKRIRA
jgi:bifunctional non-homologous end joining protein LigD